MNATPNPIPAGTRPDREPSAPDAGGAAGGAGMPPEDELHQDGDTAEERAAFLKWWESSANWTGSPCAVAYAGWLARKPLATQGMDRAESGHIQAPSGFLVIREGWADEVYRPGCVPPECIVDGARLIPLYQIPVDEPPQHYECHQVGGCNSQELCYTQGRCENAPASNPPSQGDSRFIPFLERDSVKRLVGDQS